MNRHTQGYIVIGGDRQPLRWYPDEHRFYLGIFGESRPAATIFWNYEAARSAIGSHYKTRRREAHIINYTGELKRAFKNLRIVRLINE